MSGGGVVPSDVVRHPLMAQPLEGGWAGWTYREGGQERVLPVVGVAVPRMAGGGRLVFGSMVLAARDLAGRVRVYRHERFYTLDPIEGAHGAPPVPGLCVTAMQWGAAYGARSIAVRVVDADSGRFWRQVLESRVELRSWLVTSTTELGLERAQQFLVRYQAARKLTTPESWVAAVEQSLADEQATGTDGQVGAARLSLAAAMWLFDELGGDAAPLWWSEPGP